MRLPTGPVRLEGSRRKGVTEVQLLWASSEQQGSARHVGAP